MVDKGPSVTLRLILIFCVSSHVVAMTVRSQEDDGLLAADWGVDEATIAGLVASDAQAPCYPQPCGQAVQISPSGAAQHELLLETSALAKGQSQSQAQKKKKKKKKKGKKGKKGKSKFPKEVKTCMKKHGECMKKCSKIAAAEKKKAQKAGAKASAMAAKAREAKMKEREKKARMADEGRRKEIERRLNEEKRKLEKQMACKKMKCQEKLMKKKCSGSDSKCGADAKSCEASTSKCKARFAEIRASAARHTALLEMYETKTSILLETSHKVQRGRILAAQRIANTLVKKQKKSYNQCLQQCRSGAAACERQVAAHLEMEHEELESFKRNRRKALSREQKQKRMKAKLAQEQMISAAADKCAACKAGASCKNLGPKLRTPSAKSKCAKQKQKCSKCNKKSKKGRKGSKQGSSKCGGDCALLAVESKAKCCGKCSKPKCEKSCKPCKQKKKKKKRRRRGKACKCSKCPCPKMVTPSIVGNTVKPAMDLSDKGPAAAAQTAPTPPPTPMPKPPVQAQPTPNGGIFLPPPPPVATQATLTKQIVGQHGTPKPTGKMPGVNCNCKNLPKEECDCAAERQLQAKVNAQIAQDQARSTEITFALDRTEDQLDVQNTWFEQANKALQRLQHQMAQANRTKQDLLDVANEMKDRKMALRAKIQREQLERDLRLAHMSLQKLNRHQQGLTVTRATLDKHATKVEQKVQKLHGKLSSAIQQFHVMAKSLNK